MPSNIECTSMMQHSSLCHVCESDRGVIVADIESGEIICSNCGIVILDRIQDITMTEWCVFSTEEVNNRSKTGGPISIARDDMGLATIIGKTNRDASGRPLDVSMHSTMQRLRTWDSRTRIHTSANRSLTKALNELYILKDKLGLPDAMVEKAALTYRKVQDRGLLRGRTISGLMTAAIYAACRETGTPRTLNDIAAASNIARKDIARNYRLLVFEFDIKASVPDPVECIIRVANKANLSQNSKRQAINIMNRIIKKKIISAGKDPMGFAGTVLYISCIKTGENITQDNIANAAGVTAVTIKNRFKHLKKQLQLN